MIVTQLADFLNNTMIPQYLGKEAIKVEDLSPIVSVGAYTKVEAPPVEPTKVASMKTTNYTSGTATIVNTENANKPFACSSTNTSRKTLSQCITQDTDGIQNRYFGCIKTAADIIDDDYIVSLKFKFKNYDTLSGDELDIFESEAICGFEASNNSKALAFTAVSNELEGYLCFRVYSSTEPSEASIEVVDEDWTLSAPLNRYYLNVTKEATFTANSVHTLIIAKVDDAIVYTLDNDVIFIETITNNTISKDIFNIGSTGSSILSNIIVVEELDVFKINEE